jgi:hypothetical protein
VSHLRGLRERRDLTTTTVHREEHRLRRHVVVPQVMVHHLKVPNHLPGRRAQRDHGIREQILSESLAAEKVRACASRGNEDEVARRIGADDRPRIRGAGAMCLWSAPRVVSGLRRVARHRIPRPFERPAPRVERANDATRRRNASAVANSGAHDHQSVDDCRRGRHRVLALERWIVHDVVCERYLPASAEILARFAGA